MVDVRQKVEVRGDPRVVNRITHFHPIRGVDDFCCDEQQHQPGDTYRALGDGSKRMARLGSRLFPHCHSGDELHPPPDVVCRFPDYPTG